MLNLFSKNHIKKKELEEEKVIQEIENYDNSLVNSRILKDCL